MCRGNSNSRCNNPVQQSSKKNLMKWAIVIILVVSIYIFIAVYRQKEENDKEPEPFNNNVMERYAENAETTHFKLSEFHSHDGVEVPKKYRGNIQILMNQLEVIRSYFNAPISINSGYRSPAHNAAIGGVAGSMHTLGMAADIVVKGYTPKQVQAGIDELIKQKKIVNGGVGRYRSFTHYDIGKSRTWNG